MNNYSLKNSFLVRRPYFSLFTWYNLFNGSYSDNIYNFFTKSQITKKALFIASPEFSKVIENTDVQNINKKCLYTMAKYASRYSSRAIPFGYFCGVNMGRFSADNLSNFKQKKNPIKSTLLKLDNAVVFQIVEALIDDDDILKKLNFYSNPTFYKSDKKYKFIDYENIDRRRRYVLNLLKNHADIYHLIELCEGMTDYSQIENFYKKIGADPEDVVTYVRSLIKNRILFTNIHPCITKPNTLFHIEDELIDNDINFIREINKILIAYNSGKDDKIEILKHLTNRLKDNLKIDLKNHYQLDYVTNYEDYTISRDIKLEIEKAVNFLSILPNRIVQNHMNSFIKKFKEIYGNTRAPLCAVLDASSGIGYPIPDSTKKVPQDMFETITFRNKEIHPHIIRWDWFDEIIFKKYIEFSSQENTSSIQLSINDLPENLRELKCKMKQITVMAEIINSSSKITSVHLKGLGGKTPLQLMGRFGHLDNKINDYLADIVNEANERDNVQSEILIFPEDRLGNVTQHSPIFDYEIPIFSGTSVSSEKTVQLKDLYISIQEDKLILYSKKLNKKIYPRLCNAHVYDQTDVPAYRFLCDYENYLNQQTVHNFSWPDIFYSQHYLPRIMFNKITISPARWIIYEKDIPKFNLESELKIFIESRAIPQFVYFTEGDKKLLLNLQNQTNISILLTELRKHKRITLIESFMEDDMKNLSEDSYFQEVVLTLDKNDAK